MNQNGPFRNVWSLASSHAPGLPVLGLLLGGLVVGGCDRAAPSGLAPVAESPARSATPSEAALPDNLQTLDLAGFDALLQEAKDRDQVLVVDFWATWCVPCVALFPQLHAELQKLEQEFPGRVRFVSVSFDEAGGDSEKHAIRFLAEQHALVGARIMVADSGEQTRFARELGERYGEAFNVMAVPAYLVQAPGEVRGAAIGGGGAFQLADIIAAARQRLAAPGL